MAKNIKQGALNQTVNRVSWQCSDPATPASGDPVRFGVRCGVAETAEDTDGDTTVLLNCYAELSVKGVDGSGNSAVAAGDALYYVDADTPKISKKATGTPIGYAYGSKTMDGTADVHTGTLVTSGATTTITVHVSR